MLCALGDFSGQLKALALRHAPNREIQFYGRASDGRFSSLVLDSVDYCLADTCSEDRCSVDLYWVGFVMASYS